MPSRLSTSAQPASPSRLRPTWGTDSIATVSSIAVASGSALTAGSPPAAGVPAKPASICRLVKRVVVIRPSLASAFQSAAAKRSVRSDAASSNERATWMPSLAWATVSADATMLLSIVRTVSVPRATPKIGRTPGCARVASAGSVMMRIESRIDAPSYCAAKRCSEASPRPSRKIGSACDSIRTDMKPPCASSAISRLIGLPEKPGSGVKSTDSNT